MESYRKPPPHARCVFKIQIENKPPCNVSSLLPHFRLEYFYFDIYFKYSLFVIPESMMTIIFEPSRQCWAVGSVRHNNSVSRSFKCYFSSVSAQLSTTAESSEWCNENNIYFYSVFYRRLFLSHLAPISSPSVRWMLCMLQIKWKIIVDLLFIYFLINCVKRLVIS